MTRPVDRDWPTWWSMSTSLRRQAAPRPEPSRNSPCAIPKVPTARPATDIRSSRACSPLKTSIGRSLMPRPAWPTFASRPPTWSGKSLACCKSSTTCSSAFRHWRRRIPPASGYGRRRAAGGTEGGPITFGQSLSMKSTPSGNGFTSPPMRSSPWPATSIWLPFGRQSRSTSPNSCRARSRQPRASPASRMAPEESGDSWRCRARRGRGRWPAWPIQPQRPIATSTLHSWS